MRQKLVALLDTLTAFFVFALVTTAIHEFFHANVTRALGGSAYVVFGWFGGYAVPSGVSGLSLIAVAFSGGIGTFLLFLYFERWWLEDPTDYYVRIPCRFFMLSQLFYAIAEGTYFLGLHSNLWLGGQVAQVVAVIVLAFWYLWWKNDHR